jgi:hypothetical protein
MHTFSYCGHIQGSLTHWNLQDTRILDSWLIQVIKIIHKLLENEGGGDTSP